MEGYGVSKKDKPHYFDPQKWKQQKLEAMTDAAVRQKNAALWQRTGATRTSS